MYSVELFVFYVQDINMKKTTIHPYQREIKS